MNKTMPDSNDNNKFQDCLLITIHGVQSKNKNIEKLVRACKKDLPGLQVHYVFYQCVHPALVLGAATRQLTFGKIIAEIKTIRELKQQNKNYSDIKRVFVFAHSFGTLSFCKYLEGADSFEDLRIETAVLAGSILPQRTEWIPFIQKNVLLRRVYNVTRPFDPVVHAAQYLLSEQTLSGARGFIKSGLETLNPLNIFKFGGHSGYASADAKEIVCAIKNHESVDWIHEEEEFENRMTSLEKIRLKLGRSLGII